MNTSENAGSEGAVNFDAGLVKQEAAEQMQRDSVSESPATLVTDPAQVADAVNSNASSDETPNAASANTISMVLFVTFNLSRPDFTGLKALKSVPVEMRGEEQSWNFYNPFTSGRQRVKEAGKTVMKDTGVAGVIRSTMQGIIATADSIVGKDVVYVGNPSRANALVSELAGRITRDIRKALPTRPTQVVLPASVVEFEGEEYPTPEITFGDVLSVSSWVAYDNSDAAVREHTIYTNLVLNAGQLYDAEDPHSYLSKSLSVLQRIVESAETPTQVYVGVTVDSRALLDEENIHDLALVLKDDMGFETVTKAEVLRNEVDWIPCGRAESVFTSISDFLLFRALFVEEASDEGEEEAAAGEDDE